MMKKIFALVVLLVLGKFSYSQSYPLQQSLGSDSTIVISKGALQSRLIPIVISDTTAASAQRMKNYPGAQLYTSNGNFYIRNASATKWLLVSSGSVGSVNIYNSDGTLTGARTVNGGNDELLFQNFARYSVEANTGGVIELNQGSNSSFIMNNDTSRFSRRVSYSSNLGSSFTKHSLVDKNYVDSSIGSIPSGGTVTSVATNNSTGITGGTITTSGTLAIDTTLISTRAWRQKGIDSVQANINALTFQKSLINGSTLTQNNTVNVNKKGFTWNNGGYYEFNDSLGTTLLSMSKSIIDLFVANAGTGVPSAAISLGRGVYISGGDSISISPYQGKLNISSLRSGAGSKALKYDPTTGVVSYSDTTAASGGTVTSVGSGYGLSGGPITTTGTLSVDSASLSNYYLRRKDSLTTTNPLGYVTNKVLADTASAIRASLTGGTVTSVATNNGTGITGGTITSTGTLAIDTTLISTRAWRQKGVDSVAALITGGGYVPYVGATQDLNLGTHGLRTDFTQFRTATTAADSVGRLVWNSDFGTLNLGMGTSGVVQQVGLENYIYVHNSSGQILTDGTVVYMSGATGNHVSASLADNRYDSTALRTIGVVTQTIPIGGLGYVTTFGAVNNLNLGAYNEGDIIYLGQNGGITNVEPTQPNHNVQVGVVARANAGNGILQVAVKTGLNLNQLDDVKITSPTSSSILVYQPSTSLWVDTTIAGAGLAVTSVATNTATGITGGTITTTGTLAIDTTLISTRLWRQKGIDSVQANLTAGLDTKLNISDTASMLSPYKTYYPRNAISLTTTGSSGASTYNPSTGVLNVPVYTDQYVGTVTSVATNNGTGITGGTITTSGTLAIDTTVISTRAWRQKGIDSVASLVTSGYVPTSRTLTINGTSYDLSANRTWSVGTVTSVATNTNTGITGGTITGSGTLAIDTLLISTRAWRQKGIDSVASLITNNISGTTNYIPKFTGSSSIGNSNLRTDASGNLGLGNAPSAWSFYNTLQIGNASFSGFGNYASKMALNWYQASDGDRYISNGYAAAYEQDSNGDHRFYVTSSGTAGGPLTFTDAMIIKQSGNILVGTITDAGYKLNVNGTGRFSSSTLTLVNSGSYAAYNVGDGTYASYFGYAQSAGQYVNNSQAGDAIVRGYNGVTIQGGDGGGGYLRISSTGAATLSSLAGTGSRIVVADASGTLSASSALSGYITGSGTTNYVPKFTSSSAIGNSLIYDDGTNVGIGTTSPSTKLHIASTTSAVGLRLQSASPYAYPGDFTIQTGGYGAPSFLIYDNTAAAERFFINSTGNVGIGTSSPIDKLHIAGGITSTSIADPSNTAIGSIQMGYDGTNGIIRTWNSSPILMSTYGYFAVQTYGSERMRITSGGNVGIGTSSPATPLDIVAGSGAGAISIRGNTSSNTGDLYYFSNDGATLYSYIRGTSTNLEFRAQGSRDLLYYTNSSERMRITSGGNVGIGTTSPGYKLEVNGDVAGVGAYVNLSDARLKKDIVTIDNALDKVLALRGVYYNWDLGNANGRNLDSVNHIGLIAQEVEPILPQVVKTAKDENQTKSIAYSDIIPVLINAIKELKAEIEELKKK